MKESHDAYDIHLDIITEHGSDEMLIHYVPYKDH
jgi:hypothetical protein